MSGLLVVLTISLAPGPFTGPGLSSDLQLAKMSQLSHDRVLSGIALYGLSLGHIEAK